MNERTYEQKDENYIPLAINAGGIIIFHLKITILALSKVLKH